MEFKITIDDADLETLAVFIASKVTLTVTPAAPEEADDLGGGDPAPEPEPEVTLTQVQDAIRLKAGNDKVKPKVITLLAKFGGAKRGTDLKKEDYAKFLAEINKLK